MPDISWNKRKWDTNYHWKRGGDGWSDAWGTVEMQWHSAVLPRIHAFVPCAKILEIGPGYGRWSEFLKDLCDELILVDLSQRCIDACQARFKAYSNIKYYVNDGRSLAMIADRSIDFVYSFDSLVHVEADVLEVYLQHIAKKLKPDGIGFIHHSNIGRYARYFAWVRGIPVVRVLMRPFGFETKLHDRAISVTAEIFAASARQAGLHCISQELINWHSPLLIDCLSVITPEGSVWLRENRVVSNPHFMSEAQCASRISALYGSFRPAA